MEPVDCTVEVKPGSVKLKINPEPIDSAGHQPSQQTPSYLSSDLETTWLNWQCRMVAGTVRAGLYRIVEHDKIVSTVSVWPSEAEEPPQLLSAALQAFKEQRGIVLAKQKDGRGKYCTCDLIASPILVNGEVIAVVSMMVSTRSESQQYAVLQLIQWGGLWLDTQIHKQSDVQREVSVFALALVRVMVGYSSSQTALMAVVNRLADQLGCERVGIGCRQGLTVRLEALSHIANFDTRTVLIRRIEAVMEEALDQSSTLVYPKNSTQDALITRAHRELSQQQSNDAICTIPLLGRGGTFGAITFERPASAPFDKETVRWIESLAKIVGPVLEMKKYEERSIFSKGSEAVRGYVTSLFGPCWLKLKLSLISIMALLALLSQVDGSYRVTAPAVIEGSVRQILVAPHNSYIKHADVRAGDVVKQGQLMVSLDDRNLQLEYLKWQSERNKTEKEYQQALAKRERVQLSILRAQLDQVDAELHLVEIKIARTQIRAPFDGIVLSGDLSQSLGSPVETGQTLFEVAPLDRYRVVLEIDEHDVADLTAKMTGQLITAALPQSSFIFSLGDVVPIAVSEDGRNYFRVEATLEQPSALLRSGMRGVAKVEIGRRNLLWIWTHSLIERLKLQAWLIGL